MVPTRELPPGTPSTLQAIPGGAFATVAASCALAPVESRGGAPDIATEGTAGATSTAAARVGSIGNGLEASRAEYWNESDPEHPGLGV